MLLTTLQDMQQPLKTPALQDSSPTIQQTIYNAFAMHCKLHTKYFTAHCTLQTKTKTKTKTRARQGTTPTVRKTASDAQRLGIPPPVIQPPRHPSHGVNKVPNNGTLCFINLGEEKTKNIGAVVATAAVAAVSAVASVINSLLYSFLTLLLNIF
jgi:tRNA G18 (ribose-2'-O)-methylase SpoU